MTRIDVLICTYKRDSFENCLNSVLAQIVPTGLTLGVIVADNAPTHHAKDLVNQIAGKTNIPITYVHAPHSNISVARNACLDISNADWIAFIDDDEFASTDWLQQLWENRSDADVLFGEVRAVYPVDAPDWVRTNDVHSTRIEQRHGAVETGFAGNVFLRWKNTPWAGARFDPALGQTGGEDTDFFHRLYKQGAKLCATSRAVVFEPVESNRLKWMWMFRRKFRSGQSYGELVHGFAARVSLMTTALAKILLCFALTTIHVASPRRRGFWLLRGVFHCGVFAACFRRERSHKIGSLVQ